MNILFYSILFIIGMGIGGYWAIKAKGIPKNLDMKKTHCSCHSHAELISALTYIVIGGISSVVLANVFRINIYELEFFNITVYIFAMLYVSTLVLIGGIDRLYSKIQKEILAFGIISSIIYMLYLCFVDFTTVNINALHLLTYIILLIIDTFLLRKYATDSYIINALLLLNIILTYTDFETMIYTIIMAFVATILYTILIRVQNKKDGNKKLKINEIPVGFFISASNIVIVFSTSFFKNYYMLK